MWSWAGMQGACAVSSQASMQRSLGYRSSRPARGCHVEFAPTFTKGLPDGKHQMIDRDIPSGIARARSAVLIALPILAVAGVAFLEPLPQDLAYHRFADTRRLFGIDNALNVVSNLPFLLVGIAGLRRLLAQPASTEPSLRLCYAAFFTGVLLTAAGSAWYHLQPTTNSLVWDRLPMTVALMALTAVVFGEFVSRHAGRYLLAPLLLAGLASAGWWALTEARGAGDLRAYVLVQFLPLLLIPCVLLMYPGDRRLKLALWGMLSLYLLAKIAEHFDTAIYDAGHVLSGHTLKHLLAAAATWLLVPVLPLRVASCDRRTG